MRSIRFCFAVAVTGCLALAALTDLRAFAQDASAMTCDQLWLARNSIYARAGYCFKTPRGVAVFGPGCFAPFGQLSGYEKARVDELQMWERRRGC